MGSRPNQSGAPAAGPLHGRLGEGQQLVAALEAVFPVVAEALADLREVVRAKELAAQLLHLRLALLDVPLPRLEDFPGRAVQARIGAQGGSVAAGAVRVGGHGLGLARGRQVLALQVVPVAPDGRVDRVPHQLLPGLAEGRGVVPGRRIEEGRLRDRSGQDPVELLEDEVHVALRGAVAEPQPLLQVGDLRVHVAGQPPPAGEGLGPQVRRAHRLHGQEPRGADLPAVHLVGRPQLVAADAQPARGLEGFAQEAVGHPLRGAPERLLAHLREPGGEAVLDLLPGPDGGERVVGEPVVPGAGGCVVGRVLGEGLEPGLHVCIGELGHALRRVLAGDRSNLWPANGGPRCRRLTQQAGGYYYNCPGL